VKPRLLDLFAGAQGAAVGYARAGFEVHAVDIEPHDKHPEIASFATANAFDVLADVGFCRGFDVIAAGPPCRDHTDLAARVGAAGTAWMLPTTLLWLRQIGRPWVVENVESAKPIRGALMLCGSMFGLEATCRDGVRRQLRRHRLFASSEFLTPPRPCFHRGQPVGVYGTGGGGQMTRGYKSHPEEAREAMGIDWMSREDIAQAIPPAYTQWIGEQLLDALGHDRPEAVSA
jgi:DNA (cytosine-5)-methyltransferase 1